MIIGVHTPTYRSSLLQFLGSLTTYQKIDLKIVTFINSWGGGFIKGNGVLGIKGKDWCGFCDS